MSSAHTLRRIRAALGSTLISLGAWILPQAPELDAAARARILERLRYRSSLFALGASRNGNGRPPGPPL